MRKRPFKALLPILLTALFLCNTLIVAATEVDEVPPTESPAVTESVTDSGQPTHPEESAPAPEPEETPDAAPPDDSADSEQPPEDIVPEEPPEGSTPPEEPPLVWLEVDTFEELYEALDTFAPSKTTRIRLISNITVPAIEAECTSREDNLYELDLGPYTLYVEGTLRLQSGVTLMGSPGDDAMIRVRPGGEANINNVTVQAGDRCAVWQEEGAIFTMSDFTGEVHYADKAVAMPYSFISWQVATPVAVVHDGQTLADVLPETDNVQLTYSGEWDGDAYIPVSWDTDDFREGLDSRTRTVITGSYPDAIAFQQPVCLVVFQNGNPATFLDAYGIESYGWPKAKVKIELIEPELGCRFEWSQDGETWLPADAVETPSSDGRLAFTVSFPQETPPTYPYYLSAVVDYPEGSIGYSDVLIIESADSECGSGGNRHGGTGVAPPELPPLGGSMGEDDNDDGMGGITPDEPDHSGESDGSEPPSGGGTDKPDKTPPPVVNPPIENDRPEQSIPPSETPGQSVPPAGSDPPAQSTPPVNETSVPPLATEPLAIAAVEPSSPHAGQTETVTSTPSSAGPEPSTSASPRAPDAALAPEPQTTADVQEALAPVVTETETLVRDGGAPSTKTVVQVAAGVIATGGIITLTMTWGIWSKRLVSLLRKLLNR